jgi:hypothetical protein
MSIDKGKQWEELQKTAESSKIKELLEKNGFDAEDIGHISTVRLSSYQTVTKDEDGNATVHDLEGLKFVIHPAWNEGPKWEIIRPADPVNVSIGWTPTEHDKSQTKMRCAFILPDPQIGFRRYEDGTLDPFHDVQAIDVALQIMAYVQEKFGIDVAINLGDFLDLPEHSRFIQEAAFANTTQLAINYGHEFLAKQRAIAPKTRIVLLEGNHDNRLNLHATRNAAASYGLKKANDLDGDPVLSVKNLLCLDELGVEFYDKYPSQESQVWLGKYLRAMHGTKVRSNGSTAAAYTNDTPHLSSIFGHIHRIELQYRTTFDSTGPIRSVAFSPGCLCRVDGAVPSVNAGIGADGKPGLHFENWQQGVGIVWYNEETGRFAVESVHIIEGHAMYQGQEFQYSESPVQTPPPTLNQ